MADRVKVVALKRIRKFQPGEVLEVTARDAKVLFEIGLAKAYEPPSDKPKEKPVKAPAPAPVVIPPVVQPTEGEAPEPVGEPVVSSAPSTDETPVSKEPDAPSEAPNPRAQAQRRPTYQTRDLKAKE